MLHIVRSSYSFLRGYGEPKDFMKRAAEIGGTVIAADYCSTWGHVAWQESGCKALGATIPAVRQLEKDARHGLAVVVAQSTEGLSTLYRLMSTANDQKYFRPRVKWEQLADLPGCVAFIDDCLNEDLSHAFKYVQNFLLKPRSSPLNDCSRGTAIPAMDVRYVRVEDRRKYELVRGMGHTLGEVEGSPSHMVRPREWQRMMLQHGVKWDNEALYNQHPTFYDFNAVLPHASLLRIEGNLEERVRKTGRAQRFRENRAYQDRLERELRLIREKGFESYFLFVADLVEWAKQHMLVGPGRGSAGGSLVCYFLGITEVDPMVHGTLFERFIDPGRSDLPDIDVDFADIHRDKIFDYLRGRFGESKVVRVGTISYFGGKSAINDVGRVYKTPFDVLRSVTSKLDDFGQAQQYLATVDYCLGHKENTDTVANYPELEEARWIDGLPRHTGVHAAGVIVSPRPITDFGSVTDGVIALDKDMAESLGLMKMDALGLKTLSVIDDVMRMVGRDPYEIYQLKFDDPKVWDVFNSDRVTGVFQFEGQAVRGLMRRIKVCEFEDLCALTSLARPGPLMGGEAEIWVRRKNGEAGWSSPISALNRTYGVIVYQEQAMQIVRELASFDEYEVNGFRKAIGKKDPVKLASYMDAFITQSYSRLSKEQATDLWHAMENFGSYAFNYSHAVAYSMLSYYTAYLKAYYPNEFAVCYLKHTADEDSQKAILREIGSQNVVFFDPDLSEVGWSIKDGQLIGGFTNVTGIGRKTAEQMVALRESDPEGWKDKLTATQLARLENPTPFDDLHFFATNYGDVYDAPERFRIKNRVWKIDEIPAELGEYTFLGRLTKILEREKKPGEPYALLFFSDDTGELPCTISRYKWPSMRLGPDGKPFFKVGLPYVLRGDIISDGRKWLFIEKARRLHEPVPTAKDQAAGSAAEETAGSSNQDAGAQ